VLDEERQADPVFGPDPVPIGPGMWRVHADLHIVARLGEGTHSLAAGCRPPSVEAGVGVGAGVSCEVGEELVHAEQVRKVGPVGQLPTSAAGVVFAGQLVAAVRGDDFDAELPEDVVVGVGAALGPERPEPGQQADLAEFAEASLGEVEGAVQSVVDLDGGEHAVVGQPAEQYVVAVGEAGLYPQEQFIHDASFDEF
jgi:hypothetical protein